MKSPNDKTQFKLFNWKKKNVITEKILKTSVEGLGTTVTTTTTTKWKGVRKQSVNELKDRSKEIIQFE